MQRAFIIGIIIGLVAPFLGIFIVLKRYSMLSDTLAHISLLGIAMGIVMGLNPTLVTIITVILISWLIEYLRIYYKLYSDSLLSLFLSGSLSLSIIVISLNDNFNSSLLSYLFGSILAISKDDIFIISIIGIIILIVIFLFIREYIYLTLDENMAKVSGINVTFLNFLFLTLVATLIALSIHIVGTLLIGALIVIPVISALQYKQGFIKTLFFAIIFSLFAILFGLTISFYFSIPSGASIVVNALIIFFVSAITNRN
jgi:zinc transport system permease protein